MKVRDMHFCASPHLTLALIKNVMTDALIMVVSNKVSRILLGLGIFSVLMLLPTPEVFTDSGWKVVCVAVLMLTWWITEATPIPVTALLPIIMFPLLEVVPLKQVTANYANPIVFLFMGGFVLALAMERWQLHKRIAIGILRLTGTRPSGIVGGFMLATAFLSMWMSNTATTVMMLPIALSVLHLLLNDQDGNPNENIEEKSKRNFAVCVMLGIAFAANIGGTATIIGTPPNAILAGYLDRTYGFTIQFADWMMIGLPFAVIMLALCWFVLTQMVYRTGREHIEGADDIMQREWKKLGRVKKGELMVLCVFICTAFLWIFKGALPFDKLNDTTIAVLAAVSLFLLPVDHKRGQFLLQWEDTRNLPWGILLLFGGGLALAGAMQESGLIELVGTHLSSISVFGIIWLVVAITALVLLMTEMMSNLALITVFLPVLSAIAYQLNEDPLLFAIPATLAASCAFMLPMATPPNAIVFASGYIRIPQMIKAGILMNLFSIILISLIAFTLLEWVMGISPGTVPGWVSGYKY